MKRYWMQMAACCIWVVLFGVSCATTQPVAEDKGQPEAAVAEKAGGSKGVKAPAAMEQDKKMMTEEKTSTPPVPTVSFNIVQVNKEGIQPVKEKEDLAEMSGAAVEQPKQQKSPVKQEAKTSVTPAEGSPVEQVTQQLEKPKKPGSSFKMIQYMPDTSASLGTETLLSEISKEIAGKVFYELQEEGERNFTAKVAVVNAVPLSDFKRETEFGRVMAEYLLTDLADRGLRVTELRMGQEINILPQTGEFIMTRNIGEIANNSPELDFVVVSTFTNTRKTLIIQGRLVSLKDGLVKTTWRYGLPLNRELLGLFHEAEKPFTIAVKGMYK